MLSDPISDMLTRIRNANMRSYRDVPFSFSKFKWAVCEQLHQNKFLLEKWASKDKNEIKIRIRHFNKFSAINQLERISKPSQRIYLTVDEIKKKCLGRRIYFISTSKGLMSHRQALKEGVGGGVVFYIS